MGHLNGYPRKCNFLIINKLQIRLKLGCQSQEEVSSPSEKMTFTISPQGEVNLLWGNRKVTFQVK